MAARILLVAHAPTAQAKKGCLPSFDDEPDAALTLDPFARRTTRHLAGPEQCCRATAATLGLRPETTVALSDLQLGFWAGQPLATLSRDDPTAVERWLSDPHFADHGGESITGLVSRVGGFLEGSTGNGITVAVTSPAVARAAVVAAIGASPACFFAVDVAALDAVEITLLNGRLRLRRLQPYPTWLARS